MVLILHNRRRMFGHRVSDKQPFYNGGVQYCSVQASRCGTLHILECCLRFKIIHIHNIGSDKQRADITQTCQTLPHLVCR